MKITPKYTVSTSPFLHAENSTPKIMWEVVYTLLPIFGLSIYLFGLSSFLVVFSATIGCFVTEFVFDKKKRNGSSLKDGSGFITGLLLGLTLPPGFPLWMAFLGGVVAIGMGKIIWGGLGQNIFNPALVGRAFLQAAFPTAITTWSAVGGEFFALKGTNLAMPFLQGTSVDAISGATPLAKMKFDAISTSSTELLLGNTMGSLGETGGLLLLLSGGYLIFRKIINWRIPVGVILTVILFSSIFWLLDSTVYPSPMFMVFSGGLMLGTIYMATDLVTSPITPKGIWLYSIGIGFFVVLIRLWGGLPEGVMYAILLMNAATPLLNRFTKIKPYGYQ
jgi:Na+-translocating ferredoxin:NAD+ oxidoreductase subunit D